MEVGIVVAIAVGIAAIYLVYRQTRKTDTGTKTRGPGGGRSYTQPDQDSR